MTNPKKPGEVQGGDHSGDTEDTKPFTRKPGGEALTRFRDRLMEEAALPGRGLTSRPGEERRDVRTVLSGGGGSDGVLDLSDEVIEGGEEGGEEGDEDDSFDDVLPEDLDLDGKLPPESPDDIGDALDLPGKPKPVQPQFTPGGTQIVPLYRPDPNSPKEPVRFDNMPYIPPDNTIKAGHRGLQAGLKEVAAEVSAAFAEVVSGPSLDRLPEEIAERLKRAPSFSLQPLNYDGSYLAEKDESGAYKANEAGAIFDPSREDHAFLSRMFEVYTGANYTLLPQVSSGWVYLGRHATQPGTTSAIEGIWVSDGRIIIKRKSGYYEVIINDGRESPTGLIGMSSEPSPFSSEAMKVQLLNALKVPGAKFKLIKLNPDGTAHGKVTEGEIMESTEANHARVRKKFDDFPPSSTPEAGKRFYYQVAEGDKIKILTDVINEVHGYQNNGVLLTLAGGKPYRIELVQ